MNRYPLWKYVILVDRAADRTGVHRCPTSLASRLRCRCRSGKATIKVDATFAPRVEQALEQAGLKPDFVQFEGNSVKARVCLTPTPS